MSSYNINQTYISQEEYKNNLIFLFNQLNINNKSYEILKAITWYILNTPSGYVTRKAIAQFVGCSIKTVSRANKFLLQNGLIKIEAEYKTANKYFLEFRYFLAEFFGLSFTPPINCDLRTVPQQLNKSLYINDSLLTSIRDSNYVETRANEKAPEFFQTNKKKQVELRDSTFLPSDFFSMSVEKENHYKTNKVSFFSKIKAYAMQKISSFIPTNCKDPNPTISGQNEFFVGKNEAAEGYAAREAASRAYKAKRQIEMSIEEQEIRLMRARQREREAMLREQADEARRMADPVYKQKKIDDRVKLNEQNRSLFGNILDMLRNKGRVNNVEQQPNSEACESKSDSDTEYTSSANG